MKEREGCKSRRKRGKGYEGGLGGYCAEIGAIVMKEGEGCKLRRKAGQGFRKRRKGSESGAIE